MQQTLVHMIKRKQKDATENVLAKVCRIDNLEAECQSEEAGNLLEGVAAAGPSKPSNVTGDVARPTAYPSIYMDKGSL